MSFAPANLLSRRVHLRPRCRRPLVCSAAANFRARWSLDVKFGSKTAAVALLQEWVATVGAAAGLTPDNTVLTTGSIGAPESTLELEVSFGSLAELEEFWSAIPPQEHRAWGERMQQHIVHGSPQWRVHRCLAAFPQPDPAAAAAAAPAAARGVAGGRAAAPIGGGGGRGDSGGLLQAPSEEDVGRYAEPAAEPLPAVQQQTASGLSVVSGDEEAAVVLDWKGDPMRISPGDKLPFKFL